MYIYACMYICIYMYVYIYIYSVAIVEYQNICHHLEFRLIDFAQSFPICCVTSLRADPVGRISYNKYSLAVPAM